MTTTAAAAAAAAAAVQRFLPRFLLGRGGGGASSASLSRVAMTTATMPRRSLTTTSSSTPTTYYDSQSGRHVPIHDENRVSVYMALDDFQSIKDKAETCQASGIRGVVARPRKSNDETAVVLPTADEIANLTARYYLDDDFTFFVPVLDVDATERLVKTRRNVVPLLEFPPESPQGDEDDDDSFSDVVARMQAARTDHDMPPLETALWLSVGDDGDAMLTASAVAGLVDGSSTRGGRAVGDYIVVAGQRLRGGDDIVELAEELCYLDVTGPTMKSRLVIDLSRNTNQEAEETLEDCLTMGVNKFVIDEERLKWMGHYVRDEAGKECDVWSM